MHTTRCLQVSIRFSSPNHALSRVSCTDGPTSIRSLLVAQDEHRLVVQFLDKDDDCRKEIVYNFSHVLEYTCEGWVDEPRQA